MLISNMRPNILVIQFRCNPQSIEGERAAMVRGAGVYADVDFKSALDSSIDWQYPEAVMNQYQGVILGGSGDFDFDGGRSETDPARRISYEILGRLRPLFTYLLEHDIPTLGICFGHQILGAFAGAQVISDTTQSKQRSHKVALMVETEQHFLFSGLPKAFFAHYNHKDVLDRIPKGASLLMSGGQECKISALRYKQNIYTTQFHPELTAAEMAERLKRTKPGLAEGELIEELFCDDPSSNRILENFSKFVVLYQQSTKVLPCV